MENFNYDPNKKYRIKFIQTPTNSLYKFIYNLKPDIDVNIKQNDIPVELKMKILNTINNNLN